jgi:PKD repeat protein
MAMLPLLAGPAYADSAPVPPTPRTVTADSLPTAQINGVVWDQVVVGDTVFATGSFTRARPPGAAAGTSEVVRSHLVAYRLSTGALLPWAPTLNAQGLAIEASADGSVIYVGGEFTSVSGVARSRIVALNAATGTVLTGFTMNANSRVRALEVDGSTLYAGGTFTTVAGQSRSRLAKVDLATNQLTPWAPVVDSEVYAIVAPGAGRPVVAGGRFQFANSQEVRGLAALDRSTAALVAWPSYGIFPNYGPDSSIYSLSTDGSQVFGTAYDYFGPSEFEGSFGIDLATGTVNWVNGCKGDTYASYPIGDVLYSTGHPYDCGMVGGHPQSEPWTYQRAMAQTISAGADGRVNTYGAYSGYRAPELLHWLPTFTSGSVTGASQAGWDITGNAEYVVVGGEFPRVNGTLQQGLSRFRIDGPDLEGPQGRADMTPTLVSFAPGTVRVRWTPAWDRDNRTLTYEVLRGATLGSSVVVGTVTADSTWWNRAPLVLTDTTAPPGSSQTYRVRATDAFSNAVVSNTAVTTITAGQAASSPYSDAVLADAPRDHWRLGETGGTTAYDWAGADDLTLDASAARGAAGAVPGGDGATTFTGTATVPATGSVLQPGPQSFAVEAWFSTTSTSGGKILGFGNSTTGDSSGYDRHVYMTNDGRIVFGAYPNDVRTVTSPLPYNDGQWHHVVASLGSSGMDLYVDGKRVGRRADTTSAQNYSGYWRIGGDNLGGWPEQPASTRFAGSIDEVAVYPGPLTLERVQAHYTAGGGQVQTGVRPADEYGRAVYDLGPDSYWRLDETSGTTAVDVTANTANGTYFGGTSLGAPGRLPGTAASFDGIDDGVASGAPISNPDTFSTELWFSTTSTAGGKLIGFGDAPSGRSGNYDRHVYMSGDGRLNFGVWTGTANIISAPGPYNDGQWHHVVATQGADGMRFYVDGQLAGSNAQTAAQPYTGYWRVGGDSSWEGNAFFAGSVDDVAVYSSVLTPAQVSAHHALGGGGGQTANQPPVAAFTSTEDGLSTAVDASTSTDPDGTVAAYSWSFGDGATAQGPTASHTYAAAGTYDVAVTVTDDDGATDVEVQPVTVVAPPVNAPPTAAFTSSATGLAVSFDGSVSADADGTVTGYAWTFGDGATAQGPTPSHTYTAGGTYSVVLTVIDDDGRTATTGNDVTVTAPPPANAPPTASFTAGATGLQASFDAAASSDPDGTITGYAWTFGDGASGTGPAPAHTYTAPGTYEVTLVVTDNGGATAQSAQPLVLTAAPTAYATDTFTRSVTGGLGTADAGGAWSVTTGASDFSVAGGTGLVRAAASKLREGFLPGVSETDCEVNVTVALDRAQTGGGTYVSVIGRRVGTTGDYRAKLRFLADASVQVTLTRMVGTTETTLAKATIPGLVYTPGAPLRVELDVGGTGTTQLAVKVWPAGGAEPAAPLLTATDTTAALQAPGSVGVGVYTSASATNGPMTGTFDDLSAGPR